MMVRDTKRRRSLVQVWVGSCIFKQVDVLNCGASTVCLGKQKALKRAYAHVAEVGVVLGWIVEQCCAVLSVIVIMYA